MNIDKIIREQRQYFYTGATRDVGYRIFQLNLLSQVIKTYEPLLIEALQKDLNKCEFEAYATEIGLLYGEIRHAVKQLPKWSKPETLKGVHLALHPSEGRIQYEPKGVVLIVAPWNYPVQLTLMPLIGAIAAGNCAVLKPSELTPNVSGVLEEMISKYFKPEYLKVVQGDHLVGETLTHGDFDHIFFTGSVPVGKLVKAAAAKRLVPVTLELGGKSPCVVDETADLDMAAKRIAWGKLVNAGQTCIAPDFVMVQASVKSAFVEKYVAAIQAYYGMDSKKSKDYGRIVNEKNTQRLANLLEGLSISYGGDFDIEEKYFGPTVVEDVPLDHPLMQEEIFGPILPVLAYGAEEEVTALIRTLTKPLAFYVFSENKTFTDYLIDHLAFGGGCVNDTLAHIVSHQMPFGGVGESGVGNYHGKYSFMTFSHLKSTVSRGKGIDGNFKFPPFNKMKLVALRKFLK